jgi:hypothetical protein
VNSGRSYVLGLVGVAAVCFTLTLLVPSTDRFGAWLALATGLVVQGPIGWWLARAVGTPRFLLVWVVGIGTRLVLVALFAFGLIPALSLPLEPTLYTLVGVLLSLLLVEVIVVNIGQREARVP